MNSRFLRIIWVLLAIGAVVFSVIASTLWIIPALLIIVIVTLLTVFTKIRPALLRNPLRWLRAHPLIYWFLILLYLTLAVGWWVYKQQPTNGRGLTNIEFCYLC